MAKKFLNPHFNKNEKPNFDIQEMVDQIKVGNKVFLSKAITLIESEKWEHLELAANLLSQLGPPAIQSKRIAITGSPGVGKSSFIEALSEVIPVEKIAVLAIDPSSSESGGSILGDKTRMEKLSQRKNAFVRPSPAGKTLGGVASKTRESILLCEHAGYQNIFIETVGVGQSETMVSQMVDLFILLILPGSGDEIQGIKRGIVELADLFVITKNDQDRKIHVQESIKSYRNAIHLFRPKFANWKIPVLSSSIENPDSMSRIWNQIEAFFQMTLDQNLYLTHRKKQQINWFENSIHHNLRKLFEHDIVLSTKVKELKIDIEKNKKSALEAVIIMQKELNKRFTNK